MNSMKQRVWMLTLVTATSGAARAEASPDLVRPSPDRLHGSLLPPASEPMEARLERQAAENVLLQFFGLAKAGFAPHAARDEESLFPLIYDGVLVEERTSGLRDADILAELRALFVDDNERRTMKYLVAAAAMKALQIPPRLYELYPAAEAFQRQFAVYYTNERRRAADRVYLAHRCDVGSLPDVLQDPFAFGVEGRAQLDRYMPPSHLSNFMVLSGLGHLRYWSLDIGAGPWSGDIDHIGTIRGDRSTEDPAVLQARVAQALQSWDLGFQQELLVILMKMMVAEPVWTDVVWEGPALPPIAGLNIPPPVYPAEPAPRLHPAPFPTYPRSCLPHYPESYAAEVDFKDPYLSTRSTVGWSLTQDQPPQSGWHRFPEVATDVGASADGALWWVSEAPYNPKWGKQIYRRTPGKGGRGEPMGHGVRIAVGSHYNVAIVDAHEDIFRWTDQGWQQVPGKATDVGIAEDGSFWIIGNQPAHGGFDIHRWTPGGWQQVPGAAVHIDVGNGDSAVVANAFGDVFRWDGATWIRLGGSAADVAVGADGGIWRLNQAISDGSGFQPEQAWFLSLLSPAWVDPFWVNRTGGRAYRMSARNDDRIVVTNWGGDLFEYIP